MLPWLVVKLLVLGAMLCAAGKALCAVPPAIVQQAQEFGQEDDIILLTAARREVLA